MKAAPLPAPVMSWTGFYLFGGAGGGLLASDTYTSDTATGVPLTINQRMGGSGWFGTVGGGYDWQVTRVGLLVSWRLPVRQLEGYHSGPNHWYFWHGEDAGRLGGRRAGRLPHRSERPFLRERWLQRCALVWHEPSQPRRRPVGAHTNSFNTNGWFIGGGVENNLNIFGITAPGWFMKTEYRSSFYDNNSRRSTNWLTARTLSSAATSTTGLGCRPSALLWSTASTGLVRGCTTDFHSYGVQEPRQDAGAFSLPLRRNQTAPA